MYNFIPVNYDTEEPTVSARDLHKALNFQSRFSRLFENNKRLFVEGEDYNKCTSNTVVNNGAVRELEDYQITMIMAKHLAMMSRTEKGKEVFTETEKEALKQNATEKLIKDLNINAIDKDNYDFVSGWWSNPRPRGLLRRLFNELESSNE